MTARPTKAVRLDQAQPGLALAAPVLASNGLTIVPAGVRLNAAMIQRLAKIQVSELVVSLESADALTGGAVTPAVDPETARLTALVEERFRGHADPVMAEIKRVVLLHLQPR